MPLLEGAGRVLDLPRGESPAATSECHKSSMQLEPNYFREPGARRGSWVPELFFVLRAPFRSLGLMVSVFRILCFRAAGFHYLGSWLGLLWLGFSGGGGLGPSTLIKF